MAAERVSVLGVEVDVGHVQRFREEGCRRSLTREELGQLGTVLTEAATTGKVEVGGRLRFRTVLLLCD